MVRWEWSVGEGGIIDLDFIIPMQPERISQSSVSNSFGLNMSFLTVNADRYFADSPTSFAVSVGCCYFC
jgi:hypothetical protein